MKAVFGKRRMFVSSYVKGHLLTHDAEQAGRYDEDTLISRKIAVNVLLELGDTAKRLIKDAGAIHTPSLLLAGSSDWVVDLGVEREFFERLGSSVKRMRVFDGMYHDILHEKDRRIVLNDIKVFVRGAFAREEPSLDAGEETTRDEYEHLRRPLALLSLKRLWFASQRAFMKTTGRLSDGIRLGWRAGFDSGSMLDYVYENRARGKLVVGKLMDRVYLNSAGWAGIRQRKLNVERLLHEAIERVSETGAQPHIVDVATGQGRYVIDALTKYHRLQPVCSPNDGEHDYRLKSVPPNVTALLRDYDTANVEAARALAAERGLKSVRCEQADAFNEASYALLNPGPNIAIVSGLFELFSDNALVRRCLDGIAGAIDKDG